MVCRQRPIGLVFTGSDPKRAGRLSIVGRQEMRSFKDSKQREWSIAVNVGMAKAVRAATNINLFDLYQSDAERVFSDPITLVDVLYALCREQCQQRGVTDVDFGAAMVGDCLEESANALMEEVADFFPSRRRTILRATLAKAETIAKETEAKLMEALDKISLSSLTKSPEQSASIQQS
jgi:hypothetical protein